MRSRTGQRVGSRDRSVIRFLKKVRLWCLYRSCRVILVLYRAFSRVLPEAGFRFFSDFLFRFLALFIFPRGRIFKNLDMAFGQSVSRVAKRGLAKGVQYHLARSIQDCLSQWLHPDLFCATIQVSGLENLQAALSKGRGVIGLGAHLGNFILVGAKLGLQGYPFHSLVRFPNDPVVRSFIEEHVEAFHQTLVPSMPRRAAVDRILGILKKNQIVYILGDNFKRGRVPVLFFQRPVLSSRGPASLALRSGAAVLPIYLIRNYQGELELRIDPEIPITRNGSPISDVEANTRLLVQYLEDLVRRYPDQWNWLTLRLDEASLVGGRSSARS